MLWCYKTWLTFANGVLLGVPNDGGDFNEW